MTLSVGLAHRQTLSHRQTQSLRLSLDTRLRLMSREHELQMQLVNAIRSEDYRPEGNCPDCGHRLTNEEIILGFNPSPHDFTTECPKCKRRFEPQLVQKSDGSVVEMPFLCSTQVLYHLRGKEGLVPAEILSKYPSIYRSAVVHHGSIREAFAAIFVDYPFEEISGWRAKVGPFLGKLPDVHIANCVGVPPGRVRSLRLKLGIARYSLANAVEEAVSEEA